MKSRQGRRGGVWMAPLLVALVPCFAQLAAEPAAQDWPQFRGLQRDGVSSETGLADTWGESGPTQAWRRPIGEGYSAISIVGDRLYTMYAGDHEGTATEFAAAFDARSGQELWRTPLGEKLDTQFGNGPRSTPTVAGDTVIVLDSRGTLAALATKDGSERWKLSFPEKFGSEMPHWGFSTSALVDGDLVIVQAGGTENRSHVALRLKTGEIVWTVGEGPPGYNSALAVELGGARHFVHIASDKLVALDREGRELWSHAWPQGETHAMPVHLPPNRIFASGTEGIGAAVIEVRKDGDGMKVDEIWKTRFMRNHFSSSVLHEGHIYGFDNATLKCVSADAGELAWAKRGFGKGSLILADGNLFVLTDHGKLLLVEATPEGYKEKSSIQALEGRCWTAPSLAGGRLYLRNHTEMVSYDIRG